PLVLGGVASPSPPGGNRGSRGPTLCHGPRWRSSGLGLGGDREARAARGGKARSGGPGNGLGAPRGGAGHRLGPRRPRPAYLYPQRGRPWGLVEGGARRPAGRMAPALEREGAPLRRRLWPLVLAGAPRRQAF